MADQKLKSFVALIERSPDLGFGWRSVSKALMPMVVNFTDQSLIEYYQHEDGTGQVRLSPKGEIVAPYLRSRDDG